jgi:MoxR-like ATPase
MSYVKAFDPGQVEDFGTKGRGGVGDRRDGLVYVYRGAESIVLAVNVALATGRPLLVRGPSGSGKSSLAYNVARVMGYRYYEQVITARTVAVDLLWRFDVVRRLADAQADRLAEDPSWYIEPGVLWRALDPASAREQGPRDESPSEPSARGSRLGARPADYGPGLDATPAVVLLDEIDKADPDVPNSLLVPLGSFEFTVTDTQPPLLVRATGSRPPLVVITTNEERELPPAFLRRCLALTLPPPDVEQLVAIAKAHFGSKGATLFRRVAKQIVEIDPEQRDGRRAPTGASAAEFIDAVRACRELGVEPDPGNEDWLGIMAAALAKPRDLVTDAR